MKRKKYIPLVLLTLLMLMSMQSYALAATTYYGAGNYVSSAPSKPTTGMNFYVDYSMVNLYGANSCNVAFNWNGSYKAKVSSVVTYPAPASTSSIGITAYSGFGSTITGQTFFYTSSGSLISPDDSLDSKAIYKVKIKINANKNAFNVNGSFNLEYFKKTIRHEIGHTFLLKHPQNYIYFASVMNQGIPNGDSTNITATVTSSDRANIEAKWGK